MQIVYTLIKIKINTLVLAKFRSFNGIDIKNSPHASVTFLQSLTHRLCIFGQYLLIISIVSFFTLSHPEMCNSDIFGSPLMQLINPFDVILKILPVWLLSQIRSSCKYLHRSPMHSSIASVKSVDWNIKRAILGVSNWIKSVSFLKPIDNFMFSCMRSVLMVDGRCDRSQS